MTHEEKMKRLRRAVELGRDRNYQRAEGPRADKAHYFRWNPHTNDFYPYTQIDPYTEAIFMQGQPAEYYENARKRVYDALGVKGSKFPKQAKGVAEVEGVTFVLHEHTGHKSGRKSSKHRLSAICPVCGKDIPLGRMRQHAVVHNENRPKRGRMTKLSKTK